MNREVIVVGAGPSGAAAAIALAQKGRDVLLLDRQSFPRDKTCGDGIPGGAIAILHDLGMKDKVQLAGFYEINKLSIRSPRGYLLESPLLSNEHGAASYVVPRLKFDALIQQHAVDCGVEFRQMQVKEPLIEEGRVVGVRAHHNGKSEEIRASVVVGADGVTSALARALRPDKHQDGHRAVALRTYIEGIDELPHEVEFYLYNGILPGYAWIFPLGEGRANLGLGMRLDQFRRRDRSLEDMVDVFLDMPAIKKRLQSGYRLSDTARWQLNFGSQKVQRAYDGAVLIGDAAALINPLTGGGIFNGLFSAKLAADVIEQALQKGDVSRQGLLAYENLCHAEMWPGMRRSLWIQRSLVYFPLWVDLVIRWGSQNSNLARTFISKL